MAIKDSIYENFFQRKSIQLILKQNKLNLLVVDFILLSLYCFYLIVSLVSHRSIYENLNYIGFILVFAPVAWDNLDKFSNKNPKSYNYTLTVIRVMFMSLGLFLVIIGSPMSEILKENPNFHIDWTWYPWKN